MHTSSSHHVIISSIQNRRHSSDGKFKKTKRDEEALVRNVFFFYPLVSSSLTGSRTDEFLSPSLIMSVLLTTDRNTSRPSPVCLQRFLRLHRLNMYESEYSYNNTNLQSNSLCMCIYFHINIYGCGFLFNTAKIINIHGFLVCLFAGLN